MVVVVVVLVLVVVVLVLVLVIQTQIVVVVAVAVAIAVRIEAGETVRGRAFPRRLVLPCSSLFCFLLFLSWSPLGILLLDLGSP